MTAECDPLAKVGGLGEAVAGLRRSLDRQSTPTLLVMPDYGDDPLADETAESLMVPAWAGRCWVRRGYHEQVGEVALVGSTALRRPHPYADPATGESWEDNDQRFFSFSAGVAALVASYQPDLVHFHDWHGAAATGLVPRDLPVVLTIHNLAHQGVADAEWLDRIGPQAAGMCIPGGCDPLVGAIRRANAVATVSPSYRNEICDERRGEGIVEILRAQNDRLHGVINGLDYDTWDPAADLRLRFNYDATDLSGKRLNRGRVLASVDRSEATGPVVIVLSRMARQKGIDLALAAAPLIALHDGVVVVHGAGQSDVSRLAEAAAAGDPKHVVVLPGYDETTAHRLVAGADLLLMPSRFEPCGLTQLQALRYGTVPVVTDVGGLHDTVIDDDAHPGHGTGFISSAVTEDRVIAAVARALAARTDAQRWRNLQRRGMAVDSSWGPSAAAYAQLYRELINGRGLRATPQRHELLRQSPPN